MGLSPLRWGVGMAPARVGPHLLASSLAAGRRGEGCKNE